MGSSRTARAARSGAGWGVRRRRGGLRGAPRARRSERGGRRATRSPPRSGTRGPEGAQPRHSARGPAASAARGPAASLLPVVVAPGNGPAAGEPWERGGRDAAWGRGALEHRSAHRARRPAGAPLNAPFPASSGGPSRRRVAPIRRHRAPTASVAIAPKKTVDAAGEWLGGS